MRIEINSDWVNALSAIGALLISIISLFYSIKAFRVGKTLSRIDMYSKSIDSIENVRNSFAKISDKLANQISGKCLTWTDGFTAESIDTVAMRDDFNNDLFVSYLEDVEALLEKNISLFPSRNQKHIDECDTDVFMIKCELKKLDPYELLERSKPTLKAFYSCQEALEVAVCHRTSIIFRQVDSD